MNFTLKIWRQEDSTKKGNFQQYDLKNISENMSFLEMLDELNRTILKNDPVSFDFDCREGICGMCSLVVNKKPHGGFKGRTTCQLYMRQFEDNSEITIEPFSNETFKVVKDLVVDRSAMDKVFQKGAYISVDVGSAPDAHSLLIKKDHAEKSMDAASCIGCGACVIACKNSSGLLFVSAKINHYDYLEQGKIESENRMNNMLKKHDEFFGPCSNTQECEAVCPKEIKTENISRLFKKSLKKIFS